MPDFRTLAPSDTGKSDAIPGDMLAATSVQAKALGTSFEGYFHAEAAGVYEFTLASDTGAALFLHDTRVIAEPLEATAGAQRGRLRLAAGWHPLRVYSRHSREGTQRNLVGQLAR